MEVCLPYFFLFFFPELCFGKLEDLPRWLMALVMRGDLRLIPPYSEEIRAAARELAKEHGFHVVRSLKKAS